MFGRRTTPEAKKRREFDDIFSRVSGPSPELKKGEISSDLLSVKIFKGGAFSGHPRLHPQIIRALEITSDEERKINELFANATETLKKQVEPHIQIQDSNAEAVSFKISTFPEGRELEQKTQSSLQEILGTERLQTFKALVASQEYPFRNIGNSNLTITFSLSKHPAMRDKHNAEKVECHVDEGVHRRGGDLVTMDFHSIECKLIYDKFLPEEFKKSLATKE
jgi:hypothetical protein